MNAQRAYRIGLASLSAGVRPLKLAPASFIFVFVTPRPVDPDIASAANTIQADDGVGVTGTRSAFSTRSRISALVFSSGVKTFFLGFGLGFAAAVFFFFFGAAFFAAGFFAADFLAAGFFTGFCAAFLVPVALTVFFAAASLTSFFTRVVGLVAPAVVT